MSLLRSNGGYSGESFSEMSDDTLTAPRVRFCFHCGRVYASACTGRVCIRCGSDDTEEVLFDASFAGPAGSAGSACPAGVEEAVDAVHVHALRLLGLNEKALSACATALDKEALYARMCRQLAELQKLLGGKV